MAEACNMFLGDHNFEHFCRKEKGKTEANFHRRVFEMKLFKVKSLGANSISIYVIKLVGNSFLWH